MEKNKLLRLPEDELLMSAIPVQAITPEEGRHLAYMASEVPDNGVVVELGSHMGKSSCYIGSAIKASGHKNVKLHCVDLWTKGDSKKQYSIREPNKQYGQWYHAQQTYDNFIKQIAQFGLSDIVEIHMSDTTALSKSWTEPIDLLFIDGDHLYEGVHADWNNWSKFVKVGGYVMFHDYNDNWTGVQKVVDTEVNYGAWERFDKVTSICTIKKTKEEPKPIGFLDKVKRVEELKDIYKGKEVWIIGTGKSLDDFPSDFFDDKITIGLNGAIYKFPNCTWWHGNHEVWREYFRDEKPDMLNKCIFCYPMTGLLPHKTSRDPEVFFGDKVGIPYWSHYYDTDPVTKTSYKKSVQQIIDGKEVRFLASESIVHITIQVAFLMGASKITLVGCEHKSYPNQNSHAGSKEELKKIEPWKPWSNHPAVLKATAILAEVLSDNGVNMNRYFNADTEFYKKGYVEIKEEDMTTEKEWKSAQEWECNWHDTCANSFDEERKQLIYAKQMGLELKVDASGRQSFIFEGESVLDIGGGPYSLLLKCNGLSRAVVLDPLMDKYPEWVRMRYNESGIETVTLPAEKWETEEVFDEVWIYNVLQHTKNPKKIIKNALACSRIIRMFEWIDTPIMAGHIQSTSEAELNDWLGGVGKAEPVQGNFPCYHGIFKGDHYGK